MKRQEQVWLERTRCYVGFSELLKSTPLVSVPANKRHGVHYVAQRRWRRSTIQSVDFLFWPALGLRSQPLDHAICAIDHGTQSSYLGSISWNCQMVSNKQKPTLAVRRLTAAQNAFRCDLYHSAVCSQRCVPCFEYHLSLSAISILDSLNKKCTF
jgi:hypothetical protein